MYDSWRPSPSVKTCVSHTIVVAYASSYQSRSSALSSQGSTYTLRDGHKTLLLGRSLCYKQASCTHRLASPGSIGWSNIMSVNTSLIGDQQQSHQKSTSPRQTPLIQPLEHSAMVQMVMGTKCDEALSMVQHTTSAVVAHKDSPSTVGTDDFGFIRARGLGITARTNSALLELSTDRCMEMLTLCRHELRAR